MNELSLQQFCVDASNIRAHRMGRPWSRGKWTWATNGHVLLRMNRLSGVEENPKAPDAEGLFFRTDPASNWMPVPVAVMPPMIDCDECDGTGVYEDTFHGQVFSEDCERCNHTGKVKQLIGVKVGDAYFDQGYLSMLQGWEISPNGLKQAWIRNGDGVAGLLMPMKRP